VQRLSKKIAVIVGSASGAGRATALAFAEEGATVVAADINDAGAKEVASEIVAAGGTATAALVDLADEKSIRSMVAGVLSEFGRIDVLHNNAAALHLLVNDFDLENLEADLIDQTFAVNVRGPILTCKHVVASMVAHGGGVIINTASMAAIQADRGLVAYGASKAAVLSPTRSVATMYGRQGIRCNAIVPNLMLTDRAKAKFDAASLALKLSERSMPRLGTPEDFARVAIFLASDDSAYIQGQSIMMDGGDTVHRPGLSVVDWQSITADHTP